MPKPFFNDTHSKRIEEIIRVNHAGEFGAKKIYQGQIKYCKNPDAQKVLKIMLDQEQKHLEYFSNKIQKGFSRPTIFMPLWRALLHESDFGHNAPFPKTWVMLCAQKMVCQSETFCLKVGT